MIPLEKLLNEYALDIKNPEKMYDLAVEYDRLEQGAAAFSFYLRCAENTDNELLQYRAMLKSAHIYERAGNRKFTVIGLLQHAVQTIPDRPEAHYFLSKYFSDKDDWRHALVHANMCVLFAGKDNIGVGYPGDDQARYQQAICFWKMNGLEEGKEKLFDLKYRLTTSKSVTEQVNKSLDQIGYPKRVLYTNNDVRSYRFPFPGLDGVERNNSRYMQDMFVLSVLNGKKGGTFIEIGSGDPFVYNNTALLEKKFGWKGLSVESNDLHCFKHSKERNSVILHANAKTIDYQDTLKTMCMEQDIDFLRINCDKASLEVLEKIPFHMYKFGVIQFQHNEGQWGSEIRDKSREVLHGAGYVLLVRDVCLNESQSFDDWWVRPVIADKKQTMKSDNEKIFFWNYMMRG